RRPEDLRETQMRARLTAVVVSINEIDAKTLEPLHALFGAFVRRPGRANLRVVERDSTKEYPAAVQVKVTALNPDLAEPKAFGQGCVQNLAPGIHQREPEFIHILGRVGIPKLFGFPTFGEADSAILEVSRLECLAPELAHALAVIAD